MQFSFTAFISIANNWIARYYYWCVLVVCVVCLSAGWFLFLQKEYNLIQNSGLVDLKTANQELQKRQSQFAQLNHLEELYGALNIEQLRQLTKVLPQGVDEITLIDTMQSFAQRTHSRILSIDVTLAGNAAQLAKQAQASSKDSKAITATGVSDSHVNIAHIALNISPEDSSYKGFRAFLSELDVFAPILNLQQMSYSPETTSYALQLETYYAN